MKMYQGFKPELIASDDDSREALCCLHYDGQSICATNGTMAVRVPVKADEKDDTKAVSIPAHVWKWVRQLCKGDDNVSLSPREGEWQAGRDESDLFTDHRAIIPREAKSAAKSLDLAVVFDVPPRKEIEVCIDARMMYDLARAMGCERLRVFVSAEDELATIRLRPAEGMGVDEAVAVMAPIKKKDAK